MRIVCISDTHLVHRKNSIPIPDGDLLIHAGDATLRGTMGEIAEFSAWFRTFPHRHKVFIAGNHDWLFEKNPMLAQSLLDRSITYLEDSVTEVEGLRIYGSPWSPRFLVWAFNLDRGEPIRRKWNLIPEGIDILVTHGPAIGDLGGVIPQWRSWEDAIPMDVGCADLRNALLRVRPKLHVCGHVHEGYGAYQLSPTKIVNASIVDGSFNPVHKAVVIDL